MSSLEKMAEAYWNAFRQGYGRVGGDIKAYPTWRQGPPHVKNETLRCLRHAVEVIREDFNARKIDGPLFDDVFPEKVEKRSASRTINDDAMAGKLK